jgi:hypothetical protein
MTSGIKANLYDCVHYKKTGTAKMRIQESRPDPAMCAITCELKGSNFFNVLVLFILLNVSFSFEAKAGTTVNINNFNSSSAFSRQNFSADYISQNPQPPSLINFQNTGNYRQELETYRLEWEGFRVDTENIRQQVENLQSNQTIDQNQYRIDLANYHTFINNYREGIDDYQERIQISNSIDRLGNPIDESYVLAEYAVNKKLEISNIQTNVMPVAYHPETYEQLYKAENINTQLQNIHAELLSNYEAQPEYIPIVNYINQRLPKTIPSYEEEYSGTSVISKSVLNKELSAYQTFLEIFINPSNLYIEVQVNSNPNSAVFTAKALTKEVSIATNDTRRMVRGLYKYTLIKSGYKEIQNDLDLILHTGKINCTLHKLEEVDGPLPCNIR